MMRSTSLSSEETRGIDGIGSAGSSSRALLGTFAFMSPEQKKGGEVDHRSDLYAVGLMAFQMLTGEESPGFELPSELNPALHPGWDAWVRRALAGMPERRFESAGAMLGALPPVSVWHFDGDGASVAVAHGVGSVGEAPSIAPPQSPDAPPEAVPLESPPAATSDPADSLKSFPPAETEAVPTDLPVLEQAEPRKLDLGAGMALWMECIPPGRYHFGSPLSEQGRLSDEPVARDRILEEGFWLGRTPVTQAQWARVMGRSVREQSRLRGGAEERLRGEGADFPIYAISWAEAHEFCERIAHLSSEGYRFSLPTEEQWECAARAGTRTRFCSGDSGEDLDAVGWFHGNSGGTTHPVGTKAANRWGLLDVHGNVLEWTDSPHAGPYANGQQALSPEDCEHKVCRGGAWAHPGDACRAATRFRVLKTYRGSDVGFRLALVRVSK
jgi:formylglycine-generating enzyme required for sulfatase activity